jgi:hypothetical protein
MDLGDSPSISESVLKLLDLKKSVSQPRSFSEIPAREAEFHVTNLLNVMAGAFGPLFTLVIISP